MIIHTYNIVDIHVCTRSHINLCKAFSITMVILYHIYLYIYSEYLYYSVILIDRRKVMKQSVHTLREQLRRKTRRPALNSVLKAAYDEIQVRQTSPYMVYL